MANTKRYGGTSGGGGGSNDWKLIGNAGTTYGTNFIGTTDNVKLAIKTSGTTAVTVDTSQNVGIGTTTPTAKLDVAGTVKTTTSHANGRTTSIESNDNLNGLGIQGTFIGDTGNYGYYASRLGGTPTVVLGSPAENNIKVNNSSIRGTSNDFISFTAANNANLSGTTIDVANVLGGLHVKANSEIGLSAYDSATPTCEVGYSMYNNMVNGAHADHFYFDVATGMDVSVVNTSRDFLFLQHFYGDLADTNSMIINMAEGIDFGTTVTDTRVFDKHALFISTGAEIGMGGVTSPTATVHIDASLNGMRVDGLQTFASDAAAGIGGLTSGNLYQMDDGAGGFYLKVKA